MTNWTDFPASGLELTKWNYSSQRGWLTSKLDNSNNGPSYSYTLAGRLASRTWARGTSTTYTTNAAGDVAIVVYNDGTAGLTNLYDQVGRLATNLCNGTTNTLAYDLANDRLCESNWGGVLGGYSVTNGFDSLLRRTTLAVLSNSIMVANTTLGYNAASRLLGVSDGVNSATNYYVAKSSLVDHIVFWRNGASVMTTQNTYDNLNRLTGRSSVVAGATVASFQYQYNAAGQRTRVTLADGSYWLYAYDSLGQLTSAVKYFWDGTPYPGSSLDSALTPSATVFPAWRAATKPGRRRLCVRPLTRTI